MLVAGDINVTAGVLATLQITLATHTRAGDMFDVLLSSLATTSFPADIEPPFCPKCGQFTVSIGKLPEMGLHPLVYVYKCHQCREINVIYPKR